MHCVIVAGLITVFIDIQFELIEDAGVAAKYMWLGIAMGVFIIAWILKENFFRISTVVFAVFFVVTLGQVLMTQPVYDLRFKEPSSPTANQSLPRIIHLILDAHIGIEGIPSGIASGQQMKAILKNFYQENEFMVFGGAYSHYPLTLRSVPHFLNFSDSPYETTAEGEALFGGAEPHKLFYNRYFELLARQGYTINILANSLHLDYCSESFVVIDNCIERIFSGMKLLKDSDVILADKLRVVFSHFFSLGYTVKGIIYAYNSRLRGVLSEYGIDLPPWTWGTRPLLMPLTSLEIFDFLSMKIGTLPDGNFLYSHLMIPHQPYVLRGDCTLNPSPGQWKNNGDSRLKQKNTVSSREDRYELYFQQLTCVYRKLDALFDQMRRSGIFEDSIIILNGDHGSRITKFELREKYLDRLSKNDFVDEFSTLFAIKLPARGHDYSTSRQPIERVLAKTMFPKLKLGSSQKDSAPFIYLRGDGREPISFSE